MSRKNIHGLSLPELIVVITVIAVLLAVLVPNFIRSRATSNAPPSCKSNLRRLGDALEMYAKDNGGRFPTSLAPLTPRYMRELPACPSADKDTYSSGFTSASAPDVYTVVCAGNNHGGVGYGPNFPQYSSIQGLIEK